MKLTHENKYSKNLAWEKGKKEIRTCKEYKYLGIIFNQETDISSGLYETNVVLTARYGD